MLRAVLTTATHRPTTPFKTLVVISRRDLSWLRSPGRTTRLRTTSTRPPRDALAPPPSDLAVHDDQQYPSSTATTLPVTTTAHPSDMVTAGLAAMLSRPQLAVTRQIEMMNVLMGYEQANQYAVVDDRGAVVGWVAEHDSLARSVFRNVLHSHRPLRASVLDMAGTELLALRRPFTFINSTIHVTTPDGREIGTVEQEWHLWRRRYNLFLGDDQFARIDAGFLSWSFPILGEEGEARALIDRNFTGFGRELFTDTGHYAVHLDPNVDVAAAITAVSGSSEPVELGKPLSMDERAVVLAAGVTIDCDYFSRDRGGFMPLGLFGIGGGGWSSDD